MRQFLIRPHYFASLLGSLVATNDSLMNGRILSDRDLFSSKKYYETLSKMYSNWSARTQYSLSKQEKTIINNALGLYIPWMNTLATGLDPENKSINEVKTLFTELISEINKKMADNTYSSFLWDGSILEFQLRLGTQPYSLIEELLTPVIDLMAEYQKDFYNNFWEQEEQHYYQEIIDSFTVSRIAFELDKGIQLLKQWIFNSQSDTKILICLNRYLGSLNENFKFNSGFGLRGLAKIHIAPKFLDNLDSVLHEVFHTLCYQYKPIAKQKEIVRIGKEISLHFEDEPSPIPFWSWAEIYVHEIEEVFADFFAEQVCKTINLGSDFKFSYTNYADSDEFLRPIYQRLSECSSLLKTGGLELLLNKAFNDWEYKKQ